jgi:uncharacterized protein (TIGR02246 family)
MAKTKDPLASELLELERQYWQAIQDRDGDQCARLSDEECIVTGAQGVSKLDRKTLIRMMKESDQYTLDAFRLDEDVQVHRISADVAILAYKVHEELTVDGEPVTLDAADASTWVRRDGRWLCALHTESILGDPFGRDRHAP